MSHATELPPASPSIHATRFWNRVDETCERWGDSINPILVKETRQALKSRQFVVTFSFLLFAALAWTVAGSLSLMPQIYTTPSAPRMLIGYYVVLAIPMLLVVPLAAYRSLEGEIDDGTLELLSITTLSPRQIVMGKLASASLQMMLYFIALFPCVAYAYTLRGVDLPTVMILMAILLIAGLLLTTIALFFAPLAASRTGRVATLLAVLLILLISEYVIAVISIGLILYGNPTPANWLVYLLVATPLFSLVFGHLLTTASAAQLTPESENRSTPLRLALSLLSATTIALVAYPIWAFDEDAFFVYGFGAAMLLILWILAGSMLAAESPAMTPRIRRELPSSFLARMFFTWLTPGPTTGLIFAAINVIVVAVAFYLLGQEYLHRFSMAPLNYGPPRMSTHMIVLTSAYLIGYLIIVRLVVATVRINNHPRVELGIAALIAVSVLASLVPYSIGLHLNDYRPYAYSRWQVTNWFWTLAEAADGSLSNDEVGLIAICVGIGLLGCVLAAGRTVLPGRTATPKRVLEEWERESAAANHE